MSIAILLRSKVTNLVLSLSTLVLSSLVAYLSLMGLYSALAVLGVGWMIHDVSLLEIFIVTFISIRWISRKYRLELSLTTIIIASAIIQFVFALLMDALFGGTYLPLMGLLIAVAIAGAAIAFRSLWLLLPIRNRLEIGFSQFQCLSLISGLAVFFAIGFMKYSMIGGFVPDRQVSYRLVPNKRYGVNSKQLRGPEVDYDKKGKYRILALGDSFTFGYGLPDAFSWPRTLERMANMPFHGEARVEVLNAGIPGHDAHCFVSRVQHLLPLFKPDLTIILFNFSMEKGKHNDHYLLQTVMDCKNQGVHVVLATGPVIRDFDSVASIRKIARAFHAPLVQTHRFFERPDYRRLLLGDVFHPNANGDLLIAQTIYWRLCEKELIPTPPGMKCKEIDPTLRTFK